MSRYVVLSSLLGVSRCAVHPSARLGYVTRGPLNLGLIRCFREAPAVQAALSKSALSLSPNPPKEGVGLAS